MISSVSACGYSALSGLIRLIFSFIVRDVSTGHPGPPGQDVRSPTVTPNPAAVILRSPLLFQIPDVLLFDMYNVIHYIWKYQIGGQPEGSG